MPPSQSTGASPDRFYIRPATNPPGSDLSFSGQWPLGAAAQGLGVAIMHDAHFDRAADGRLASLFDIEVDSPYSYWFICKPHALDVRAVRIFHDWVAKAGL